MRFRSAASCLQKRYPTATQAPLTAIDLSVIAARIGLNLARGALKPGLSRIGSAVKPAMAFVVGEIKIVGVVQADAGLALAHAGIPANEVDGVAEVIPVRTSPAGIVAIPVPRAVQSLRITVSRTWSRAWKDEQKPGACRPGVSVEAAFTFQESQLSAGRNAPTPLSSAQVAPPGPIIFKDQTRVMHLIGRAGRTRRKEQGAGQRKENRSLHHAELYRFAWLSAGERFARRESRRRRDPGAIEGKRDRSDADDEGRGWRACVARASPERLRAFAWGHDSEDMSKLP